MILREPFTIIGVIVVIVLIVGALIFTMEVPCDSKVQHCIDKKEDIHK
jgi:hypothetical protein